MNALIHVETLNLLFWVPNKCQIINVYINFAVKYNTITQYDDLFSFYTEAIFFFSFRRRRKKRKKEVWMQNNKLNDWQK